MRKIIALILAGGTKPPMEVLSIKRTKAAIPFAGFYRIIDFPLSNLMNAGIEKVGVLTQHRPDSLMDHIGGGSAWDYSGRGRVIQVLPPHIDLSGSRWYQGTADAINQNQDFFNSVPDLEHVLVIAGDHVYQMNFDEVIKFHESKNAHMTLVVKHIKNPEGNTYGHVRFDSDGKIVEYEEKPGVPRSNYISLCIYIFRIEFLREALAVYNRERNTHDIGREIIRRFLHDHDLYTYQFDGPWYYLGDIKSYCDANMEMLASHSEAGLSDWHICTNLDDRNMGIRPPAKILPGADVQHSMISDGCFIEGQVINSVLSPGVKICRGAEVNNSIILHDCVIEPGARINGSVLDKDVWVSRNCRIGEGENTPNTRYPDFFYSGISVIGRSVRLLPETVIGKNCVIFPGDGELQLPLNRLISGKTFREGSSLE